jgi:ATP-dependent Clp protease ATP-binding subunit ClpA
MSANLIPTPRYAAVLSNAEQLARQLGHQHVGVEHLFLAIIQDPHAIPTQVLAQTADLPEIEERLRSIMSSAPYSAHSSEVLRPRREEDGGD